jgi:hypothetical protein
MSAEPLLSLKYNQRYGWLALVRATSKWKNAKREKTIDQKDKARCRINASQLPLTEKQ